MKAKIKTYFETHNTIVNICEAILKGNLLEGYIKEISENDNGVSVKLSHRDSENIEISKIINIPLEILDPARSLSDYANFLTEQINKF